MRFEVSEQAKFYLLFLCHLCLFCVLGGGVQIVRKESYAGSKSHSHLSKDWILSPRKNINEDPN